ncbi:hypothetical protein QBC47DRAFT_322355 [Echria macrotheca]|uniref:CHAT domain-containing protein n=1 Tax=Echria macrotheca TaxID=438768 RepID=A0AAJ0BC30_9PEZI|nr:hypothetical protein QBC47DRAFT_322355 [Echria macrotheca]
MPFVLQVREVVPSGTEIVSRLQGSTESLAEWEVELRAGSKTLRTKIQDPFHNYPAVLGASPEDTIAWYLEKHISEPYESTRAQAAVEILSSYGRDLAAQITGSGLLPRKGDIRLHIISSPSFQVSRPGEAGVSQRLFQQLHWEILEDVKLWPAGLQFGSVSVARSVAQPQPEISGHLTLRQESPPSVPEQRTFRILLVVSRPRPEKDVDYQLVAKCLVAIVKHVKETSPDVKVSLRILRPPTWQAFREHLRDSDYDLVHFDMKGEIQTRKDGSTSAVLEFCKPDLGDPLKMKKDLRTADEVGKELAEAGVKTVVLNACNSASFRNSSPGSNLAEVLLGYGVYSVLAMAYKVVEEAVEVFMSAFYQALVANRASVLDATRIARSALLHNQSRRARYMHTVNLADYIVPVLYTSAAEADLSTAESASESSGITALFEKVVGSLKKVSLTQGSLSRTNVDLAQSLLGRDYNVLSLEVLLSVSRIVYLHGQGGVGKTELLRYVCEWWQSSGWIKGAAYIQFADEYVYDLSDVLERVVEDLGFDLDEPTAEEVADKLRGGKYLLVFDSADVYDTPVITDRSSCSDSFRDELKEFIDSATAGDSMVIVSSRLETSSIFSVPTERHKYRLGGLSVLDSVTLLQDLAFGPHGQVPEIFYRRENIDSLRRAAILLEGNPAAIKIIIPELRNVGYSGEKLYYNMMYGVCKTENENQKVEDMERFLRTVVVAQVVHSFNDFDKTMISVMQFAPFWNIMPKDLNFYYWFLYLFASKHFQEASIANWISKEFKDLVYRATMAKKLKEHWPELEEKLIKAGILTHATITRKNGDKLPCYHVHPLYTLTARSGLKEEQWKEMRFAYVRQALLWDPGYETLAPVDWTSVEWEGAGPQHEDYLHNWRHIAVAWSVSDGNPIEDVKRMGISMLDCTYRLVTGAVWDNPRQSRVLIPHIRAYLLQSHMIVELLRPGSVPTLSDLRAIVEFTWSLYRFEADDVTQSAKSAMVKSALSAVDRWKAASPPGEAVLPAPLEVTWFQLRHAEALIVEDTGDLPGAKALFERNLMTDPVTDDVGMINIIRRWHLQSLQLWASSVVRLDVREGRINSTEAQERLRGFVDMMAGPNQGNMLTWMMQLLTDHEAEITKLRVRDQHAYALEKEPEVAAKFGSLAQSILDGTMLDVFADHFPAGQTFAGLKNIMAQAQRGGDPLMESVRSEFRGLESGIRMLVGDTESAAGIMQPEIAREGLSSTTSNGWEKLAEVHMTLYMMAVLRAKVPDYRKGLTHIQEWWKLHRGVGISKRDHCYGLLKFAACYNGLGQIVDLARTVIKIAEVARTLTPADCVQGEVVAAVEYLQLEIAKFSKLDVFLDPRVVFFRSDGLGELSIKEKVMVHQIVTQAKQTQQDEANMHKAYDELQQTLRESRDALLKFKGTPEVDDMTDDLIAKIEKSIDKTPRKETDFWLF